MITCLNCGDENPDIYRGEEWACCGYSEVVYIPQEYEEDERLWRHLRRFGISEALEAHYPGVKKADLDQECQYRAEEAMISMWT